MEPSILLLITVACDKIFTLTFIYLANAIIFSFSFELSFERQYSLHAQLKAQYCYILFNIIIFSQFYIIMTWWVCFQQKYMQSLFHVHTWNISLLFILSFSNHVLLWHIVRDELVALQPSTKLRYSSANTKAPELWPNMLNQKETSLSHVSSANPALYTDTQGFKKWVYLFLTSDALCIDRTESYGRPGHLHVD